MTLNIFVLTRRFLSLAEVGFGWNGEADQTVAVLIGLGVSVAMVVSITTLRLYLLREKQNFFQLADATLDLAKNVKAEDSGAFKLAQALIREREDRREANTSAENTGT